MKKFLFGILLSVIGSVFTLCCCIYAAINPWDYNGITGLTGSLLGMNLMVPFIIFLVVMIIGILICLYEAYFRK